MAVHARCADVTWSHVGIRWCCAVCAVLLACWLSIFLSSECCCLLVVVLFSGNVRRPPCGNAMIRCQPLRCGWELRGNLLECRHVLSMPSPHAGCRGELLLAELGLLCNKDVSLMIAVLHHSVQHLMLLLLGPAVTAVVETYGCCRNYGLQSPCKGLRCGCQPVRILTALELG